MSFVQSLFGERSRSSKKNRRVSKKRAPARPSTLRNFFAWFERLHASKITLNVFHGQVVGCLLLSFVLFLFVCFLSYNELDPSLNVHQNRNATVSNWGGVIGATVADMCFQAIGWASFILAGLLFWLAMRLLFLKENILKLSIFFGALCCSLCASVMLSMVIPTVQTSRYSIFSGGIFGNEAMHVLLHYFNTVGAWIVVAGGFLVCLYISTRFSVFLCFKNALVHVFKMHSGNSDEVKLDRLSPTISQTSPSPPKVSRKKFDKKFVAAKVTRSEKTEVKRPGRYRAPTVDLFDPPAVVKSVVNEEELRCKAVLINEKLAQFGIGGKIVNITPGPVVTVFEFQPGEGVRANKVSGCENDLALVLKAQQIRIDRVKGKDVLGIEVPNSDRQTVFIRNLIESPSFMQRKELLTVLLGRGIQGDDIYADLATMPHLLVAGATGTGKSVTLNSMLVSLLFRTRPDDVKLVLIDPKMLEFSMYEDIPHLLMPVVTDPKKASAVLRWCVAEMERRYQLLNAHRVRNIDGYHQKKAGVEVIRQAAQGFVDLPYIVVVIDELADLMMVASKDIEDSIMRIAQKARACGIHLILATQRPSVNVITGVIKANLPSRIACQVTNAIDSRTILDCAGADKLLGRGDMLYKSPRSSLLQRVHGAYISDDEVKRFTDFLKSSGEPVYSEATLSEIDSMMVDESVAGDESGALCDSKYDEAVAYVSKQKNVSVSGLQRHFSIGFNRSARLIEMMEREGVVGPSNGSKPRDVLVHAL